MALPSIERGSNARRGCLRRYRQAQAVAEATASLENQVLQLEQQKGESAERIMKLQTHIAKLDAKLKWYEEHFRLSQQKKFGSSSEKTSTVQLTLFNEAEAKATPAQAEPTMESITYKRRKRSGQREAMLKDLPVVDAFSAWLQKQLPRVLPKSYLGKAIAYCLEQWPKLTRARLQQPLP